jgi:hypothetical protein
MVDPKGDEVAEIKGWISKRKDIVSTNIQQHFFNEVKFNQWISKVYGAGCSNAEGHPCENIGRRETHDYRRLNDQGKNTCGFQRVRRAGFLSFTLRKQDFVKPYLDSNV